MITVYRDNMFNIKAMRKSFGMFLFCWELYLLLIAVNTVSVRHWKAKGYNQIVIGKRNNFNISNLVKFKSNFAIDFIWLLQKWHQIQKFTWLALEWPKYVYSGLCSKFVGAKNSRSLSITWNWTFEIFISSLFIAIWLCWW